MGVFQIKNKPSNRTFLRTTTDLDHAFNSDLFQLNAGMHFNQKLQDDWNKFGADNFDFVIYDELKSKEIDTPDKIKRDLQELLEIHHSNLADKGELLY